MLFRVLFSLALPLAALLVACGYGVVLEAEPQFPRCRELAEVNDRGAVPPV